MFVWDAASAKLLREVDAPPRPEPGMLMWGLQLAVSPDSALLARGYADRTVRVWDIDGPHVPMVLRGHLHLPEGIVFSPDSRTLATTTIYTRGFSKTEGLQRERGAGHCGRHRAIFGRGYSCELWSSSLVRYRKHRQSL